MQLYDITIAVNQTRQLDAPGSYFYYYAGSAGGADSTITLSGISSGLRLILKPGQAFRLPKGQKEHAWMITNYAGTATIIGSVLVGDGDITDNRITGSVEVIDGGKNLTKGLSAFVGVGYASATAGTFMATALWNKSTTKNLVMKQLRYDLSGSGYSLLHRSINAAFGVKDQDAQGKLINSAISASAETRVLNSGGAVPTNLVTYGVDTTISRQVVTFNEPIIIPPSTGYMLAGNAAVATASSISAVFEFTEESI